MRQPAHPFREATSTTAPPSRYGDRTVTRRVTTTTGMLDEAVQRRLRYLRRFRRASL